MATMNKRKPADTRRTHEGARVLREGPVPALKRLLNAHMLWEDTFYIDGVSAADQLKDAVRKAMKADHQETMAAILDARHLHNIRHASLLAAVEYAKAGGTGARQLITTVIGRADELAEVLVMAGVEPGKPPRIPHAVRKGVRDAFNKFDEYQLAKYKGEGKAVSMRDAVFITHPKGALIEKIVNGTLKTPNTWETRLSAGEDKRTAFEDLLRENKLGSMALLRNLRNMVETDVDPVLVREALDKANWSKVLPFRFMSAVLTAPRYARDLDRAFSKAVAGSVYLPGSTAVMIDTSASMSHPLSEKSMVRILQAAATLGAAVNGDRVDMYEWADRTRQVPNFGSLSTAMAMGTGAVGHGTDLAQAMDYVRRQGTYDRYIVISDMQFNRGRGGWARLVTPELPKGTVGYTINMAPYDNPGLVLGEWTHLTGFSARTLDYIASIEG